MQVGMLGRKEDFCEAHYPAKKRSFELQNSSCLASSGLSEK